MLLTHLKLGKNMHKTLFIVSACVVAIVFLFTSALGVALIMSDSQTQSAYAEVTRPTEPTNCTPSSTPSFNGYTTNLNNPNIDPTLCQDIPALSFHPVLQTNPRSKSIEGPTNFQLTYINSAAAGVDANSIINPKVKVAVAKVSDTQYTMSTILSGDNVAPYNSSSENPGGNLTITIPQGYKLKYVQRSTRHYDTNLVRDYESKYGDGRSPFDFISDNGAHSNPIFTQFDGQSITSTAGFNLAADNALEAGFLPAGYILFTLDIEPIITNQPPVLTGQEITIIRGQRGSFTALNPTDPDGDLPISLSPANFLPYCTPTQVAAGSVITCEAVANAPKRATFTITPTDSRGLSGAPATFIVNILDPGLDVVKSCVKKGTQTPCADAKLVTGDVVTYRLNLTNTGETDLTNVVMVDDYDQTKLSTITNVNPPATSHDTANGILVWEIGNLAKNGSVLGTFDATVSVTTDTTILNKVTASADGVPSKTSEVEFPVVIPNTPPQIPGETITIIRGQSGSFKALNPTDPENDTPISLAISNALNFCDNTSLAAGKVITCQTNATTPKESTFTITPTDSRGLVGTPGTFKVLVIDPGLNIVKSCVVPAQNNIPCNQATLYAGDTVSYSLVVSNSGDTDLTGVIITDDYDQNKIEKPTSINPIQSSLDETNGIITWNVGKMVKGASPINITYSARIKSSVTTATTIKNIATADSNETEPKRDEEEFPVKENLPPQIPGEEIIIVRGDSGSFKPLNPTDPENNTPISLEIANKLDFCTPTSVEANTVITCKTDANTPKTSQFTITPTDSKGLVGTPGTFVVRVIDPSLDIVKSCVFGSNACNNQKVGDEVTYTLTIVNNGEIDLTGVEITDDYNQTYLSNITPISSSYNVKDSGDILTWTVGTLAKGQSIQVSYKATITAQSVDKTIENTAVVDSNETDPKKDTYTFPVLGNPALTIVKSCIAVKNNKACKDASLTPLDKVVYRLTVTNTGNSTAQSVRIVDDYDQNRISTITAISNNGDLNEVDGIITWKLGNLEAGKTLEVTYQATIAEDVVDKTIVENTATVSSDNTPPATSQYNFPVIVNPPMITPRTGGIAILASWGMIFTIGGSFYAFSRNRKYAHNFVPARTKEDV